ncbi:diguanylate cyclase domain-containing protein [Roseateles chitinivorans]|uniref:GGDEF domain-containing protein n=1 Tax=Roseateles chitinivorans TaxID=2917965 RepID=UPI003D6799B1
MATVSNPLLRRIARVLQLSQAVALVLVIGAAGVLVDSARRYGDANDLVAHTHEVLDQLNQLRSGLLRGGIALRNFALVPQAEALQRLRAAAGDARQTAEKLESLVQDNPAQLGVAAEVRSETLEITGWYLASAVIGDRDGAEALRHGLDARITNDASKRLRQLLDTMERTERSLLASRQAGQERGLQSVKRSALALAALFIAFTLWTIGYASRLVRASDRDMTHLATTADTDPLTGLANRRSLERRARELAGQPISVIVFDLDDFKPVNDRHGHAAGDAVLRAVGQRLRAQCRDGDLPARVGGDEFVLLLSGAPDEFRLAQIRQRLLQALTEPIAIDGGTVSVGASIGYAVGDGRTSYERLLEIADDMSYEEKKRRKLRAPLRA